MAGKKECHGRHSLARGIQNGNDHLSLCCLHSELKRMSKRLISFHIEIRPKLQKLGTLEPLRCLVMPITMRYLRKPTEPKVLPTHLARHPSLQRQQLRSPGTVLQHLQLAGDTTLPVGQNRLWSPPQRLQDRLTVNLYLPVSEKHQKGLSVKSPLHTLLNHSVPTPALLRSSPPRQLTQRIRSNLLLPLDLK